MELEEMKILWKSMSEQLEDQKKLTNKLIMDMTQKRYRDRLGKISALEIPGAVVCFAGAVFLLLNFEKLDNWYLLISGFITVLTMLLLPVMSLWSLGRMKAINLAKTTYKETLLNFSRYRTQFLLVQRMGIILAVILVFTSLPVCTRIMSGKDIFVSNPEIMYVYVPVMLAFLFFFGRWGYRSYVRITKSAEEVLKELENEM